MEKNNRENPQKEKLARRSILTTIIVVPFVPFLLALGVSFYFFYSTLQERSVSTLTRIVEDHRDMIESFLTERRSDLEFVVNSYDFVQLSDPQVFDAIFRNLQKRSGAFLDLGLFNADGVHLRYTGSYSLTGRDYKEAFWYRQVEEKGSHISDIFLGYRNVPHFIIAVRRVQNGGHWLVRATIDTQFFDSLVSRVRIGRTGEAYILSRDGTAQTRRRSGGIEINQTDPEFNDYPKIPEKSVTFVRSDARSTDWIYAAAPLKGGDWVLVVRQEKSEVYDTLYSALYINLLIMAIGGAIIIVSAIYMTEHILGVVRRLDTDKAALGSQLIRATQLAEIGEMAAGFAHEINNPLQIIKNEHTLIMMNVNELADRVGSENASDLLPEIRDCLSQILLQVNRCSDITHAILKFGRKNEVKNQPLVAADIIPEIVSMIGKKAQVHGIAVETAIEDAGRFMGDPSQFQQVMLNLLNNAMDAVIERHGASGGRIRIASARVDDQVVEIRVSDNGTGIDAANLEKIFSPFFTTKPVGRGTGLGLSVCYGIIENAGGTMDVTSEVGKGTTFIIRLPALN